MRYTVDMLKFYKNTEIAIFEDFISENEAKYLLSVAGSVVPTNWNTVGENSPEAENFTFWDDKNLFMNKIDGFNYDLVRGIQERMIGAHKQAYSLNDLDYRYTQINIIHKFTVGQDMSPHADRGPHETNNDISHGFIVYINDEYEGGEIYYPNLGHSIKPMARSLVIHPGTSEYTHGVRPVESGVRHTLTMFARDPI